jgi:hypothetical protein
MYRVKKKLKISKYRRRSTYTGNTAVYRVITSRPVELQHTHYMRATQ